jgi:hypothetical protein
MQAGYTIRVTRRSADVNECVPELYQAAIDDQNLAKLSVRALAGAALDALVEAPNELSRGEIAQLGLQPGQIRRAP